LLNAIIPLRERPGRVEGVRIVERDVDLHRLAAIDHPEALDDMQLLGMRGSVSIDERLVVHPDCVDDERVALVMADRLAVPGRLRIGRMGYVEIDVPDLFVARIDQDDFTGRLVERLKTEEMKAGNAARHAA
jgi:hypothetical protein